MKTPPGRLRGVSAPVVDQLRHELQHAWAPWRLIALAPAVELEDEALQALGERLVDGDSGIADAVVSVIWGSGRPAPTWWRSPLGRSCGAAVSVDVPLTQQEAAEILGVARGTVSTLLARGGSDLVTIDADHTRPGRPTSTQLSLRSVLRRLERLG